MALRKLCWERFGWTKEKADELLLPVLKEYDRHETQLRLEAFYSFSERFAKIRSRRIQKAVTGITGCRSSEIMDLPPHLMSTPLKRSRKNKENGISSGASEGAGNQATADDRSGKQAGEVQGFQGKKDGRQERKNETDSILVEPGNRAGKISAGRKGRGRGRAQKVRGRGWTGRGRAKRAQSISSPDESGSEKENETSEEGQLKWKSSAKPFELRKSTRHRREVKYASDGQESESVGYVETDSDRGMFCEESEMQVLQKQPQVLSGLFRSEHDGVEFQTRSQPTASEHTEDAGLRDGGPCKDYLATGGGFCCEEGNNANDPDANKDNVSSNEDNIKCSTSESIPMGPHSQVASIGNNVEHLHCGGDYRVSEGVNHLASGEDLSNNHGKEVEFEDDAVANVHKERNSQLSDVTAEIKPETNYSGSVLGLRTMPFLRRKKRRT